MENPVDTVAKWLADYLIVAAEPTDSKTIKNSFKQDLPEISWRTLERAKTKIGVKTVRKLGKDHETLWALSDNFDVAEFKKQLEAPIVQKNCSVQEGRQRSINRILSHLVRKELIQRYGGKCVGCNNSHLDFLELDHVKGDGAQHRKQKNGSGQSLYRKLLIEPCQPDKYQILCKICNWMARWMTIEEIQASFKPVRFPENSIHINRNLDS